MKATAWQTELPDVNREQTDKDRLAVERALKRHMCGVWTGVSPRSQVAVWMWSRRAAGFGAL